MNKYAEFTYSHINNGLQYYQMYIIPGTTINCKPPYIKGKPTMIWVASKKRPDAKNKNECENLAGMNLLPLEN